jgi:ABC-2 type transport system ATP-binding protein
VSVVISSHLLRDIERVCDRVIIVSRGRVVEHASLAALKSRHENFVELTPSAQRQRFAPVLSAAGWNVTPLSNGKLRVKCHSTEGLLQLLAQHDLPPAEIVANPDALHEMFIQAVSAAHEQPA